MLLERSEAVFQMNAWGKSRIPFVFIIDFEMKAVKIFRLDMPHYEPVLFDFQGYRNYKHNPGPKDIFTFKKFPIPFEEYKRAFDTVQKQIQAGNTFLTNLTFPTPIETNLTLREIFLRSTAKYKILFENAFVCFSPETFVTIKNGIISTYPMKGTMKVLSEDSEGELLADKKEIAEHHTIVDLLRNDLSMVASAVKVNRFRYVDRIQRPEGELLQVSSEITGKLPDDYYKNIGDIIFKLLPAGSVTGAPKDKTVSIIRQTERQHRGYYTGVCGIYNGTDLNSAVMIRFIENHLGNFRFRSGGGITFLSKAYPEYKELIDKVYVPII